VLVHLDADGRMRRQKGRQRAREELRHRRGVGRQPHHSADTLRVVRQLGAELIHIGQDALRMAQQGFAGGGQHHAARMPLEQRRAHGGLQVGHAATGRTQRQMRLLRAAADAARAHHLRKQRQRDEVKAMQVHDDSVASTGPRHGVGAGAPRAGRCLRDYGKVTLPAQDRMRQLL